MEILGHLITPEGIQLVSSLAFKQKLGEGSFHQFRHLIFISHFTSDLHHVSVKDNIVGDALLFVEGVKILAIVNFPAIANVAIFSSSGLTTNTQGVS